MTQISAADNLVIDAEPNRWRVLINKNFVDNIQGDGVLLETTDNQYIRYTTLFARTRRLPKNGELSIQYIQRVVLGWSFNDDAWHLGFILEPALADARGSRWCEIARWPDPEHDLYFDIAVKAGQNLARIIDRPFNLIAVPDEQRVEQAPAAPTPLPELPLPLEEWTLEAMPNGWLIFVRDNAWVQERVRRILWYSVWSVVYLVLSGATLVGNIALPRPEILPWLGIATALLLMGIVIYNLIALRRNPRKIIIDPQTHHIWGAAINEKDKPIWRKGREEVDSVYVSEVIKQQKDQVMLQHGEINLRLTNGRFYFLLRIEEALPISPDVTVVPEVIPLEQNNVKTDLEAAGVYVAQALHVPVWHDTRSK